METWAYDTLPPVGSAAVDERRRRLWALGEVETLLVHHHSGQSCVPGSRDPREHQGHQAEARTAGASLPWALASR